METNTRKEKVLETVLMVERIMDIGFKEGKDFDGFVIDNGGITVNSSTYYSGCGTDHFSFTIGWDELEKPIEWWRQYFAELEDKKRKQKEDKEKSDKAYQEKIERQRYLELKKKFEA